MSKNGNSQSKTQPAHTSADTTSLGNLSTAARGFLAGAWGGLVECVVVQPFDMVKTRHQLSCKRGLTVTGSFRDVYREGGVARFYRGALPEMAGMIPKQAAMLGTYDFSRRYLQESGWRRSPGTEFIAALACSAPEAIIFTPFQVVKIRLQAEAHLGRYRNTAHALATILREEGLAAVCRGLTVTWIRNSVWNGVYFPTMYLCKRQLGSAAALEKTPGLMGSAYWAAATLLSGFFGGTLATCFNCPFDVAKSRIQSEIGTGEGRQYRHVWPSLVKIHTEEGWKGLYKGFAPKVLRMGIGGGVSILAFELAAS